MAFYRKYRPVDFDQVIGQDHIVRTLRSAVENKAVSHAYLFTGPRGTGKTTVARNFARSVNQLRGDQDISSYMDITEIDAASNRGIDEIRALRDTITSVPTQLTYKIYIVDEAHMLTREAFNALLKTLEEPPAHVIFILATTEVHKLPETIISRTQRYDFRPIPVGEIVSQLTTIAKAEKITIDQPALEMIAQVSRGGLRDAISLLDQMSSVGGELGVKQVSQFLGWVTPDRLKQTLKNLRAHDAGAALTDIQGVLADGYDGQTVTQQLLEELRIQLLQVSTKNSSIDQDQLRFCQYAITILTQALANFKITQHPSLPLELAMIEIGNSVPSPALANNTAIPGSTTTTPVKKSLPQKVVTTKAPISSGSKPSQDQDIDRLCNKALSLIKQHNNSLYAVLRSSRYHIEKDFFIVECRFSFHKERIEEDRNRTLIEKAMAKVFGRPIELKCETIQPTEVNTTDTNTDQELVSSAMTILGGELVDGE